MLIRTPIDQTNSNQINHFKNKGILDKVSIACKSYLVILRLALIIEGWLIPRRLRISHLCGSQPLSKPHGSLFILHFNNLLKYASLTMLSAERNGILKSFLYHLHPAYREEESLDKYSLDK